MKKYIILLAQRFVGDKLYHLSYPITELEQLSEVDYEGNLIIFDSLEEADRYKEEGCVDGQIVELTIY